MFKAVPEDFVAELDAAIAKGQAKILTENDDYLFIRRADGSGVMFFSNGLIANIKYIAMPEDDTLQVLRTVIDRKSDNEANDLLEQVWGDQ